MYQQGDVLLRRIEALPSGTKAVQPQGGRYVVAEGEATGHAHALPVGAACEMFERDGTLYLNVTDAVGLTHEEHHAQTVEPGVYEVGKVVEMDPFTDEVRVVQD